MDKVKLNNEQLDYLKQFIISKGFKDHAVVLEILDHFACKVEEVMSQDASITFYDAIPLARQAFGVKGFYPISNALQLQSRRKYQKLFMHYQLQWLKQPIIWLVLLLPAVATYKFYLFCQVHNYNHIWGDNDCVSTVFILSVLALSAKFFIISPKLFSKQYFLKQAGVYNYVWFWCICYLLPNILAKHTYPTIAAACMALAVVYAIVFALTEFKTLQHAQADEAAIERFYNMG